MSTRRTSRPPMTLANLQEMQRKLRQLADSHKKAKLQALFSKQDELRPFTTNNDNLQFDEEAPPLIRRRNTVPLLQDFEAMKAQFDHLSKDQLAKQFDKQFELRSGSNEDTTPRQMHNLYGYGSDGSGEQKIDIADIEAMKAEFDKYQKLLLGNQIEKSFSLRVPTDHDEDLDVDKTEKPSQIDVETEYRAMNKMMLRYRSAKMLESTFAPQIKPKHKERFSSLMRDIGIVNQNIVNKLWQNIEDTVNDDDHNNDEDEKEQKEQGMNSQDHRLSQLQQENERLRQQLIYFQQRLMQNENDADDEQLEHDDDDGEMIIIN